MKKHLFSENEIELIRFIKSNEPIGLWSNIIQYIFDYNEFYIKLEIEYCEKILVDGDSKLNIENSGVNPFEQYAMSLNIEKIYNKFVSIEGFEKISFNEKISDVYLVKTMYYFTKHKEIIGNKSYSKNSGIINPKVEINKNIDVQYKCIVDVGIVIRTVNNNFLNCFVLNNEEDFAINSFYLNDHLIETESKNYEFNKI